MRAKRSSKAWTAILLVALAACATPDPLDWAARLEPGWQFVEGAGPPWMAWFVRPVFDVGPEGHRRTEFERPRPALSAAAQIEVDCQKRQSRQIVRALYSKRNLEGVELGRTQTPSQWSQAGGDGDNLVAYTCADTAKARHAALEDGFVVAEPRGRHRPMRSRGDLNPEP